MLGLGKKVGFETVGLETVGLETTGLETVGFCVEVGGWGFGPGGLEESIEGAEDVGEFPETDDGCEEVKSEGDSAVTGLVPTVGVETPGEVVEVEVTVGAVTVEVGEAATGAEIETGEAVETGEATVEGVGAVVEVEDTVGAPAGGEETVGFGAAGEETVGALTGGIPGDGAVVEVGCGTEAEVGGG